MKQIKFRSWDNAENKFWYFSLQEILERRMSYRGSFDEKILVGKKTQYVGLCDKNGIDIYEGDIVKGKEWSNGKSHRHIGVVTYVGSEFRSVGVKQYYGYHGSVNGIYEVIGNIYENPELVK